MAHLALNKASLAKQRGQLQTYRRFLPSLDLKRRQLMQQLAAAKADVRTRRKALDEMAATVGERLPMLAITEIDLSGVVKVASLEIEEVNRLGVTVPSLKTLTFDVMDYALLGRPHWVDTVVEDIKRVSEQRLRLTVAEEVVRRLDKAVRRITQRVNLFEKVLIPTAIENIKQIRIFLGDAERAAVVRSKIAKSKHAAVSGPDELDQAPLAFITIEDGEGGLPA